MPNALAAARSQRWCPRRRTEGRGQALCAARLERAGRIGQEGLCQQEARARADRREVAGPNAAEEANRTETHLVEEAAELILDDVGERADDEQSGQRRHRPRRGLPATSDARQASSPWVKVVSMPLPE